MLNTSKAFIVFLLWATMALTFHHYISNLTYHNCFLENEKAIQNLVDNISNKLTITDFNNDTIFTFSNNFTIFKNKETLEINPNISEITDSIANYLYNNYQLNISIYGFYALDEKIPFKSENLGLERANSLKKIFTEKLIDSSRIQTYQGKNNITFNKSNSTENALKLLFTKRNKHIIDSIEFEISNKTLHLSFNENNEITDKKLINEYLHLLTNFIKINTVKELIITGHTDNDGYFQNNVIKGLNWANTVKEYFFINGLKTIKITTNSKGESDPIANKFTEEGKAKNRRIELKIIK